MSEVRPVGCVVICIAKATSGRRGVFPKMGGWTCVSVEAKGSLVAFSRKRVHTVSAQISCGRVLTLRAFVKLHQRSPGERQDPRLRGNKCTNVYFSMAGFCVVHGCPQNGFQVYARAGAHVPRRTVLIIFPHLAYHGVSHTSSQC
ncbi:unnamed protein product, partial [Scytosiphon promiscuus]